MFSRILRIPLFLGAAVAVPYLATNGPDGIRQWWQSLPATGEAQPTAQLPTMTPVEKFDPAPRGPGYEIFPVSTPLEGNPSMSLEEIFRFDVTKEWVYERWARKSTALAELGLYGVRIPLVSGTQVHDIAGSLTYFFDAGGKVRRISFKGNTGDTTQVVALAQRYGLQPQATIVTGEQLLQTKIGNDVLSEVRTRPASVLWSSSPHDSFSVEIDLQSPDATTPLPAKALPLPDVKGHASNQTASADEKKSEESAGSGEPKGFREKFQQFFPRSRVPSEQVRSLEKRDRMW